MDEIDEINMNIIKSMSRKIKDEINIKEDDLLLLTDNIIVNKNNIKIRYMVKIIMLFLVDLNHSKTIVLLL